MVLRSLYVSKSRVSLERTCLCFDLIGSLPLSTTLPKNGGDPISRIEEAYSSASSISFGSFWKRGRETLNVERYLKGKKNGNRYSFDDNWIFYGRNV